MFKTTVLYNLPPDMDAAEFVRWRTTEHQAENAGRPGVLKTNFYIAVDNPDGSPPRYRYITESWYKTRAELEVAFYDPKLQAQLAKDGEWCTDRLFLISEEIVTDEL